PAGWATAYDAWLDDLASRGTEAVGFGLVVLRRPARGGAPTLRRLEEQHGPVTHPLGPHLSRALAAHDLLARTDDDALMALTVTVAPDVTEERHLRPGDADPTVILLRQGGGFGRVRQVGTALAGLVGASDGDLTVGDAVRGLAVLLDVPVADRPGELLRPVRKLVAHGVLEVAGGSARSAPQGRARSWPRAAGPVAGARPRAPRSVLEDGVVAADDAGGVEPAL